VLNTPHSQTTSLPARSRRAAAQSTTNLPTRSRRTATQPTTNSNSNHGRSRFRELSSIVIFPPHTIVTPQNTFVFKTTLSRKQKEKLVKSIHVKDKNIRNKVNVLSSKDTGQAIRVTD